MAPRQQITIATWAVKTALMIDLHAGLESVVPLGFYRDFGQRRAPLTSMYVFLAAYSGRRPAMATRRTLWLGDDADEVKAFAVTFTVGPVVLQVFGHFVVSASFRDERRQFDEAVEQVWPPNLVSAAWPPGNLGMSDEVLAEFADSFSISARDP